MVFNLFVLNIEKFVVATQIQKPGDYVTASLILLLREHEGQEAGKTYGKERMTLWALLFCLLVYVDHEICSATAQIINCNFLNCRY